MTKREIIESFANTENQKLIYYHDFRRIRKEWLQVIYDSYQRGLNCSPTCELHISRSKALKWLKATAKDKQYCVKHL